MIKVLMLDLLKTFTTYMDCGSTTASAQILGISQPAVTAHLQRLEETLGRPLFTTNGRSKDPTLMARELHSAIGHRLLELGQAVETISRKFGDPSQLTLRIACRAEVIHKVAARVKWPGRLIMKSLSSDEAVTSLMNGDVDLIVVPRLPDSGDLIAKPSFHDTAVLVTPKSLLSRGGKSSSNDHQITWKEWLKSDDIGLLPWAFYREDKPLAKELFQNIGIDPEQKNLFKRPVITCADWRAIMQLVNDGLAVSIVPVSFIQDRNDSIHTWPIPPKVVKPVEFFVVASRALLEIEDYKKVWSSLIGPSAKRSTNL